MQAAVDAFQGSLQLNLSSVRAAAAGEFDPSWFSPRSRRPPEEMVDEFDALASGLRDPDFKGLLKVFRDDPSLFRLFCQGPAAKSIHHAWVGGLLEHTLSLARNVDALAPNYPALDRDLLICACAFHDVGKTLEISSDPGFEYTTDGKLWGHIFMGARLVDRLCEGIPGFPEEKRRHLVHIVLSHQGDRSEGFGSAADPATPEAIFFHHLDNLDAKVQNCLTALERAAEAGEASPFTNGRGAIRKGYYRVRPGGGSPGRSGGKGKAPGRPPTMKGAPMAGEKTNPHSPGSSDRTLDCTGLLCPMPVVKVAQALSQMAAGEVLEVLADDQGVKADFPALCKGAGNEWLGFSQEGRVVRSLIRKGPATSLRRDHGRDSGTPLGA